MTSNQPGWSPAQRDTRKQLLQWFDASQRDMPWRTRHPKPANPYHVWISETMLQQTQVATVIPYFNRFIARFPTLKSLAESPLEDVLILWQGLGYYRRARHLHQAAKQAIETFGDLPTSAKELQSLQGIGPYSSAAIASIAHREKVGVVDGNVARVFARLLDWHEPVNQTKHMKILQLLANDWANHPRSGCINQATMELGSEICIPNQPRCDTCPLAQHCTARANHTCSDLPVKLAKKPPENRYADLLLCLNPNKTHLLVAQQQPKELWAGLWLPPRRERQTTTPATPAELTQHMRSIGISIRGELTHNTTLFRHALTHRKWHFNCHLQSGCQIQPGTNLKWLNLENPQLPIAKATQKAIASLSKN